VILTPPVPQSLALLDAGNVVLEASIRQRLEVIRYERCFAVLVVLDGPSNVPGPGGFVPETGPLSWIADNQKKGVSALPAVTLHARDAYSVENWDRDRDAVAQELIACAIPWLGSGVLGYEIHGWRYSRPQETDFDPCVVLEREPPLILAGDAFGGARVEGAALSGWAAAEALAECLGDPESSQT
jgi:predicted NAD/FAD-dependent oxidoreductase